MTSICRGPAAILAVCLMFAGGHRAFAAGDEGGGRQAIEIAGERAFLDLPEGFCTVDPRRGGDHAKLWQSFAPPPQRRANLLALAIDCLTLQAVEASGLRRPRSLLTLVDSPPDPRLPASLPDALAALEQRFSQPELVARAPVLGRDDLAVYVQQGDSTAAPGRISGVSAFTLRRRKPLILTIAHFQDQPSIAAAREQVARAIRSLHGSGL